MIASGVIADHRTRDFGKDDTGGSKHHSERAGKGRTLQAGIFRNRAEAAGFLV